MIVGVFSLIIVYESSTYKSSFCVAVSEPQYCGVFSCVDFRSVSINSPTLYRFIKSRASVLWPTSSNASVASLPACSSRTSSPPGCCKHKQKKEESLKTVWIFCFLQNQNAGNGNPNLQPTRRLATTAYCYI